MDDLTLIRDFRAEHDDGDPRARAAAWRELEARLEPASVPQTGPARSPRRGILALAGVGALAAIVAGILAIGSGPAAEPAAAQVLTRLPRSPRRDRRCRSGRGSTTSSRGRNSNSRAGTPAATRYPGELPPGQAVFGRDSNRKRVLDLGWR